MKVEKGTFGAYLVDNAFREGRQKGWKQGWAEGWKQGWAKGRTEGRTGALKDAVLLVLEARGRVMWKTVRARVEGESDQEVLEGWVRRAVTVSRAEDLFDRGSGHCST